MTFPRPETLSRRERVRLALAHETTDRIPIAMVCSGINPPARAAFDAYLHRVSGFDAATYLDALLDIHSVAPAYTGPPLPAGQDMWGVVRAPVRYGQSQASAGHYDEIVHYPLAEVRDPGALDAYPWPTTAWFDYDALPERIAALRHSHDPCLMVSNGNLFECSWYLRGFERMFMDFLENPELAHAILGRVTDFWTAHFRRILETAAGEVDLVFTADDIGGQQGLLLSLPMWREFIQPYHVRLNRALHEYGVQVIYHTDGAVMEAVPGLIDMGIDVLQALQFSAAGMDPARLKEAYGEQLCFQGGVCVQQTLPFGTVAQVQQEVRERIDVLGRGGGYILGPSHAIQAGTPPENVHALFETARTYYPHA